MKKRLFFFLSATCLLGACTGMDGPRPILDSRGVVPRDEARGEGRGASGDTEVSIRRGSDEEQGAPEQTTVRGGADMEVTLRGNGDLRIRRDGSITGTDLYRRFQLSAEQLGREENAANAGRFLDSGFALVYADCDAFFRLMGQSERSSRVVRDIIGPVVSVLTGVIALNNFGDAKEERLLTALSLWSSTSTAAFDIHDRHYLFGAENIDSVRELILNALTVHGSAARNGGPGTFDQASIHIMDNQAICTPSHIKRLVREAIRNGTVEPRTTGGADAEQELDVRQALGRLLNPPTLTTEQTFGLWWLLVGGTEAGDLKLIYKILEGLPAASRPIVKTVAADGTESFALDNNWAHAAAATRLLRSLPSGFVVQFQSQVIARRAAGGGRQVVTGVAPLPIDLNVSLPLGVASQQGTQRVGVSVPR